MAEHKTIYRKLGKRSEEKIVKIRNKFALYFFNSLARTHTHTYI